MTHRKLAGGLSIVAAVVLLTLVAGADDAPPSVPEYKTVFVPSVPLASKELGESEVEVDGVRFAKDVEVVLRELAREGYVVESTVPMISGIYRWGQELPIKRSQSAAASAYGYGYSVTSGVTIVARKN